jgi:hypothetical protein
MERSQRETARRRYAIPFSQRTQVIVSSLRRYLKHYQQGGFDALRPQERADKRVQRAHGSGSFAVRHRLRQPGNRVHPHRPLFARSQGRIGAILLNRALAVHARSGNFRPLDPGRPQPSLLGLAGADLPHLQTYQNRAVPARTLPGLAVSNAPGGRRNAAQSLLWREKRKICKEGRIELQGKTYRVDPQLTGHQIELRFTPFDLATLHVWLDGNALGQTTMLQQGREQHIAVERLSDLTPQPASSLDYLTILCAEYHTLQTRQAGTLQFAKLPQEKP